MDDEENAKYVAATEQRPPPPDDQDGGTGSTEPKTIDDFEDKAKDGPGDPQVLVAMET